MVCVCVYVHECVYALCVCLCFVWVCLSMSERVYCWWLLNTEGCGVGVDWIGIGEGRTSSGNSGPLYHRNYTQTRVWDTQTSHTTLAHTKAASHLHSRTHLSCWAPQVRPGRWQLRSGCYYYLQQVHMHKHEQNTPKHRHTHEKTHTDMSLSATKCTYHVVKSTRRTQHFPDFLPFCLTLFIQTTALQTLAYDCVERYDLAEWTTRLEFIFTS